jgi:hypothetical protein
MLDDCIVNLSTKSFIWAKRIGVHQTEAGGLFHSRLKIVIAFTPRKTIKVKVKLSLCLTRHHPIKAYWGNGGIAPRIFYLGTRWG